ncbi:vitamin K epoxide reductase family protein [Luteimicrobium subarcticum]|uniref:Putative membrane protein n=1 Tax=Luteimicrobium subarcticum TaxID=620910 RepID=A0A2M8WQX2_9MICO|nr:vitamin K epoxide reductase family protein [Luteimicrobium subarcticum]PJI93331.1 putative membrane protein [Luteimicrobium subarcticum]
MSELSGSVSGSAPDADDVDTDEPDHDALDLDGTDRDGTDDGILNPLKDRTLAALLAVLGAVAFVAAFILTVEDWKLTADPSYVPPCGNSIFISCAASMQSWQGKLFGFPNPFIGVAAFAVVTTVGVSMLAGFRAPRWYRAALLAGTTLGIAMVCFLVWTILYRIGRLCPYCMVVWACMIPLFWYQVAHAAQTRLLPLPAKARAFVVRNRLIIVVVTYVALLAWIVAVLHQTIADVYL